MSWLKRNIWEIHRSTALAWLGAFISLSHIIIYFFWIQHTAIFDSDPIRPLLCWSFWPNCSSGLVFSSQLLGGLMTLSLVLACGALVLFVLNRFIGGAWFFILITWLTHLLVYALDASLKTNAFTLFFLAVFGYLFIPNKPKLIPYLLVAYFLADSYTKLNATWLSGLAFAPHLDLPPKGLEWMAAFSVILQSVMPFFAISRDGQRMGYGVGSLALYNLGYFLIFHEPSYLVVALLLCFLVFNFYERRRLEMESLYQSYEHPEPSNVWWPALISIYVFAQTPFATSFEVMGPLRAEKKLAAQDCQLLAFSHFTNSLLLHSPGINSGLNGPLKCHPQVNFNRLKKLCSEESKQDNFQNMTVFFLTRDLAESNYQLRFGSDRFCDASFVLEGA